jgi:hypothetical protein
MRERFVLAAGLLVVVMAALWVLTEGAPRRAGTNNVRPSGEVARLAPGREICQPEDVPSSVRSVAIWGEARGRLATPPRVEASIRAAHGWEVRGRSGSLGPDGSIRIELSHSPPAGEAQLCVSNPNPTALSLLGAVTSAPSDVSRSLRRSRSVGVLGVDYYRDGSESWLQLAPTVADRFSLGKAGFLGGWTLWLAMAAIGGAWACAVVAIGARERTR